MTRTPRWRALRACGAFALLGMGAAAGCAMPGGDPGVAAGAPVPSAAAADTSALVPPGYGTLRQDDVTLTLGSGELQIKVTPLAEWITRLTAPDTWRRLSGLARAHRAAVEPPGGAEPSLFLVSFFTRAPEVPFRPEDLHVLSRGRRHRPLAIRPVTTGWGAQRLRQEETQTAVYVFEDVVDLQQGFAVEYGLERAAEDWEGTLQRLEVESARVRARAVSGGL